MVLQVLNTLPICFLILPKYLHKGGHDMFLISNSVFLNKQIEHSAPKFDYMIDFS